jgi:hypothetical protein
MILVSPFGACSFAGCFASVRASSEHFGASEILVSPLDSGGGCGGCFASVRASSEPRILS